jgi:hypothetical protein
MEAVTFPNERVTAFMSERVIPLRVAHNDKQLSERFQVKWTPTIITLDADGKEHHRTVGFLPPEEFIPSALLGGAKSAFDLEDYTGALDIITELLRDYPASAAAPEAIFLQGVCRYKSTKSPAPLKEAYEKLSELYPQSEWTKRAYPYRLL